MGYDGGSMSIYDALSYNIKIIAPEDSYHVGINSPYLFQNKSHFFEILDSIVLQQINNCKILEDRSIKNYCENLVNVFQTILCTISLKSAFRNPKSAILSNPIRFSFLQKCRHPFLAFR